jgi:hypothetical protein
MNILVLILLFQIFILISTFRNDYNIIKETFNIEILEKIDLFSKEYLDLKIILKNP